LLHAHPARARQAITAYPTVVEYPRGLPRRVEFPVPYETVMTNVTFAALLHRLRTLGQGVPGELRPTVAGVAAAAARLRNASDVPAGAAAALAAAEAAVEDAKWALRRLEFAAGVLRDANKPGGSVIAVLNERVGVAAKGHKLIKDRDNLFMELGVLADFMPEMFEVEA
jgi:hypothetical protein